MGIKGILFDKDGTLIDFYEVWGTAVHPVIEKVLNLYPVENREDCKHKILDKIGVHEDGIDPKGSFAWKTFDMIAADIAEVFQAQGINTEHQVPIIADCLTQNFFEEISVKRKTYPVFTDLPGLMTELNQMKIQTGLATTDEYEASLICMQKLGIDKYISFYGTAGTKMPVKPDKKLLLNAADRWNILPQETAVVGDTPNDMQFAKNAGAVAIGVLSGTGKEEDLKETADYLIDSVAELLPLIRRIHRKGEQE